MINFHCFLWDASSSIFRMRSCLHAVYYFALLQSQLSVRQTTYFRFFWVFFINQPTQALIIFLLLSSEFLPVGSISFWQRSKDEIARWSWTHATKEELLHLGFYLYKCKPDSTHFFLLTIKPIFQVYQWKAETQLKSLRITYNTRTSNMCICSFFNALS